MITFLELAKLSLLHIFSKHGVPSHITTNIGLEFISHFFRSLGKALNTRLHFTSRHHPEGVGQTERMNQTSSNTSRFTVSISKTIGRNFCPSLSSHTTMLQVLPPECHHSLPIKVTTQTSWSIQNKIFPPLEHESTPLTSTPSTNSSMRRWPMLKNAIRDPLMLNDLRRWTSTSVIGSSTKLSTFDPLGPLKNSLRRT